MKTIIVTGASSGIGREFAERLGNVGDADEVWVIARRTNRLEELKNTIKINVIPISLDLSDYNCIEKYRKLLADRSPDVIALVNAAGYGRFGEFENITLSDQLGMIELNVYALTALTYLTIPYMSKGSCIYQVGSLSSFMPVPYIGVYGATKSYVLNFTRALNVELKHQGIRAMAVCPSWTRTEFFDRAAEQNDVVTHYTRFYSTEQVVSRAMRDMKKGKDVSVCGASVKMMVLGAKLLPHKLVMKIWCKMQNK